MRVSIDANALPEGAVLRRSYGDEVHEVTIDKVSYAGIKRKRDRRVMSKRRWWRYIYRGKRYKTLSAIAREITGDPTMSGNRFFGLRTRRR